jgi:hypothetical protein
LIGVIIAAVGSVAAVIAIPELHDTIFPQAPSDHASVPKNEQDSNLNVADIDKSIANQKYQNNRFRWIEDKPALAPGPGCGLNYTGPVACELVVTPPVPGKLTDAPRSTLSARRTDVCETSSATRPVNAASSPTNHKPLTTADLLADLLKALDNYTAALAAVTKAQDRADFDIAAGKLSSAVGGLGQLAGAFMEPAPAPIITKPSVNIALWLIGKALDYQRLEELRSATRSACQPVRVITDALGLFLEDQRRRLLLLDFDWLEIDMLRKYNVDRTTPHVSDQTLGTDIDNAQVAVAQFEAARVTNPTATMRALSDAHDALVVAVRNNDGEFGALIANLKTLAQNARALSAVAVTVPPAKKS